MSLRAKRGNPRREIIFKADREFVFSLVLLYFHTLKLKQKQFFINSSGISR
ncbi:MAG: hypothetical protein LBF71_05985 [Campylobacteraceae bacterium]|nr:hypothetical protein [Campylobacteraceae bacterium]